MARGLDRCTVLSTAHSMSPCHHFSPQPLTVGNVSAVHPDTLYQGGCSLHGGVGAGGREQRQWVCVGQGVVRGQLSCAGSAVMAACLWGEGVGVWAVVAGALPGWGRAGTWPGGAVVSLQSPFTCLASPQGAGPEPEEQLVRVPAVLLCHQQCPPLSVCVPHHNSCHSG